MAAAHALDHAVWSTLTGRQSQFAVTEGEARRFHPDYGVFAAVAHRSPQAFANLGELVAAYGDVALLEPEPMPKVAALREVSSDLGVQMTASRITPGRAPTFEIIPLTDIDGPEMLALATLTEPGPFFRRTHQLGDFYGVKADGRLAAMAGERMKPDGFTEISGVCTHPDHRGRGYASALMREVGARILDRGETPFLHAYARNRIAIGIYESLGFSLRREVSMTRLSRP